MRCKVAHRIVSLANYFGPAHGYQIKKRRLMIDGAWFFKVVLCSASRQRDAEQGGDIDDPDERVDGLTGVSWQGSPTVCR